MPLTLALVAHDRMKPVMADWAERHRKLLATHAIICTGTTGRIVAERCPELGITRVASGPMGGDQQIGARIVAKEIDGLFFFVDPLSPHPHDVDVKALMRLAVVYDVPLALSARTADLLVQAGLLG